MPSVYIMRSVVMELRTQANEGNMKHSAGLCIQRKGFVPVLKRTCTRQQQSFIINIISES